MGDCSIEVVDISKQYSTGSGYHYAIQNVSFVVSPEEHIYIYGRSGSGKTTLARIIAGAESPSSGIVRIFDQDPQKLIKSNRLQYCQTIHLLQQNSYQTFDPMYSLGFTLSEQVGIHYPLMPRKERLSYIGNFIEEANLSDLWPLLKRKPSELSGGQLQRFAVIRACLLLPRILIADEPTAMLDKNNSEKIIQLLKNSFKETTLLLISHDSTIIRNNFNRCFFVSNGNLTEAIVNGKP